MAKMQTEKMRQYMQSRRLDPLVRAKDRAVSLAYSKKPEVLAKRMIMRAKARATEKGLPFNLTTDDVVIPDTCPVLGIPIIQGSTGSKRAWTANSPTLDRIDNAKGYVRGNVAVISWRANAIKNDATEAELALVLDYVRKKKT